MTSHSLVFPMSSAAAPKGSPNVPLYFFDQPCSPRRRHIWYFLGTSEGSHGESRPSSSSLHHEPGEPGEDDAPASAGPLQDREDLEAYKREAPRLLKELSLLLLRHRGRFPQGMVNILDCTYDDLIAAVPETKRSPQTPQPAEAQATSRAGATAPANKPSNPPTLHPPRKHNSNHQAPKRSLSLLQSSRSDPGWIIQPSSDEPDWIRLCQRMMEVLQVTRNPQTFKTSQEDLSEYVLCHYYDEKEKVQARKERSTPPGRRAQPDLRQKFHYKFKDGSSFIYYPSGHLAVCQSRSGLARGGFYTNVMSDEARPIILATVTPFGHGSVTHLFSSSISALWDQEGGFRCDRLGVVTKEWRWLKGLTQQEKIVIEVSDQISVTLLSGSSALLSFRCNKHRADVPLPVVSGSQQPEARPCLQTKTKFISDFARGLRAMQRSSTASPKSEKEVKGVEQKEQLEQWRQGGHAARKVKRLQRRARDILEDWLDYYRKVTGIKCPNLIRMPDARLRNQVRRALQSAEPSSLNTPEHPDIKYLQPREDKGLSRPAIVPDNPTLQPSAAPPLPWSSPSCIACPVSLRAALQGVGGGRLRCYCSAAAMPAVTDLEYDALIAGQAPQSHQILVVCVTRPSQPAGTCSAFDLDVLDQLYRRMNAHRAAPCTQCQLDSFRLVRYEMPMGPSGWSSENVLLHRRHNAAPGMFLMYIQGKLLFLGFLFGAHTNAEDLLKEISRVRRSYRLGVNLPSDYKYSDE